MQENFKKFLEKRSLEFILDYLRCNNYEHYLLVTGDPGFIEGLAKQATPEGFSSFKKSLKALGAYVKIRKTLPTCEVKGDEIAINGLTRSQKHVLKTAKRKEVSSNIFTYDLVLVESFMPDLFPNGAQGRVIDTYPPGFSESFELRFSVEIPFQAETGELLHLETITVPFSDLKLLARWNEELDAYVHTNLEDTVITFNSKAKERYNQFEDSLFVAKPSPTLMEEIMGSSKVLSSVPSLAQLGQQAQLVPQAQLEQQAQPGPQAQLGQPAQQVPQAQLGQQAPQSLSKAWKQEPVNLNERSSSGPNLEKPKANKSPSKDKEPSFVQEVLFSKAGQFPALRLLSILCLLVSAILVYVAYF